MAVVDVDVAVFGILVVGALQAYVDDTQIGHLSPSLRVLPSRLAGRIVCRVLCKDKL